MSKLRLIILFFATTTYTAGATADETIYPLVTYRCNPDADIITLTNTLLKGAEGASYNYSDEEVLPLESG